MLNGQLDLWEPQPPRASLLEVIRLLGMAMNRLKSKPWKQNQKENDYWMDALNEFYWTGLDMNKDYEATVNGVTIDDLKAFAKAFIGQNNVIEVSMSTPATK
jgi:hypothetical protein